MLPTNPLSNPSSAPKGPWIQTHSGRQYHIQNPSLEEVYIDDIAHALAHQCRFAGQCSRFYSVAEHSVHVSKNVPNQHALVGLLHDATEAYLHDITRPLKGLLPGYRVLEDLSWFVIASKFSLPLLLPQCVKDADAAMVFAERRLLFPDRVGEGSDWGHGLEEPSVLPDVGHLGWKPEHAKRAFYDRFFELTNTAV
jgi:hypothetical protein